MQYFDARENANYNKTDEFLDSFHFIRNTYAELKQFVRKNSQVSRYNIETHINIDCFPEEKHLLQIETLYFDFLLESSKTEFKEAEKDLKKIFGLKKLEEIYDLKLIWYLNQHNIKFYKVIEDLEITTDSLKSQIKKINVISCMKTTFENFSFNFFYFETNLGDLIYSHEIESVLKSQRKIQRFFFNFNRFLNGFSFTNIYNGLDLFYLFFLKENIFYSIKKYTYEIILSNKEIQYFSIIENFINLFKLIRTEFFYTKIISHLKILRDFFALKIYIHVLIFLKTK